MPRVHHAKAARGEFCDPIFPNPRVRLWAGDKGVHLQHRLICCDCGLAHDMEFQVVQVRAAKNGAVRMVRVAPKSYTIQFRARRNERSTALVRRAKHPQHRSNRMAKKRKKSKAAASLVIHGPGRMTARGRRDIVAWLRQQARHLAKHGDQYTEGQFRGSFNYV